MRKKFVEPEIKKITLNLRENIASSLSVFPYIFKMYTIGDCTIMDTNRYLFKDDISEEEAKPCLASQGNFDSQTTVMSVSIP